MNKRLYLFSLIVLPLALSSCNYKTTTNISNTPVGGEVTNTNQATDQNINTETTNANKAINANANINISTPINTNTAKPADVNVVLSGFAFSPKTVTVKKGTTVIWTNQDSVGHTVTSDSGSAVSFSSATLNKGDKYQFTFNSTGTFSYHCLPHPSMTAKIIVTE